MARQQTLQAICFGNPEKTNKIFVALFTSWTNSTNFLSRKLDHLSIVSDNSIYQNLNATCGDKSLPMKSKKADFSLVNNNCISQCLSACFYAITLAACSFTWFTFSDCLNVINFPWRNFSISFVSKLLSFNASVSSNETYHGTIVRENLAWLIEGRNSSLYSIPVFHFTLFFPRRNFSASSLRNVGSFLRHRCCR